MKCNCDIVHVIVMWLQCLLSPGHLRFSSHAAETNVELWWENALVLVIGSKQHNSEILWSYQNHIYS